MDTLLIILLIVFLLFYFGPWIAKKLLMWQLRKMQRRAFDAFNQAAQQQQAPQPQPQSKRSDYSHTPAKDAKFEDIEPGDSDEHVASSCSYTPSRPKVTDAQWEEIPK